MLTFQAEDTDCELLQVEADYNSLSMLTFQAGDVVVFSFRLYVDSRDQS